MARPRLDPEDETVQISVKLSRPLLEKLRAQAKMAGIQKGTLARQFIEAGLSAEEPKPKYGKQPKKSKHTAKVEGCLCFGAGRCYACRQAARTELGDLALGM